MSGNNTSNSDSSTITPAGGARQRSQTFSGGIPSRRTSLHASSSSINTLPTTAAYPPASALRSPPSSFLDTTTATGSTSISTPAGSSAFRTSIPGRLTPESQRLASLAIIGRPGLRGENLDVSNASSIYHSGREPYTYSYNSFASSLVRSPSISSDMSYNIPITDTRPQPIPQTPTTPRQPPRGAWINQISSVADEERRGRSTTQRPLTSFQEYSPDEGYRTYVASNRPSNYDYGTSGSYSHGPNAKYSTRPSNVSALSGLPTPSPVLGSQYRESSPVPWQRSETPLGTGRLPSPSPALQARRASLQIGGSTTSPPALLRSPTSSTAGIDSAVRKTVGFAAGSPPKPFDFYKNPGATTIRDRYPTGTGPPRPLNFPSEDPRYRPQTKPSGRAASPAAHLDERERLREQDRRENERKTAELRARMWAQSQVAAPIGSAFSPPSRPPSPGAFSSYSSLGAKYSRPSTPLSTRPTSPYGQYGQRAASPLGYRSSLPTSMGVRASSPIPLAGSSARRASSPGPGMRASSPIGYRLPIRQTSQPVGQSQAALDARMARDLARLKQSQAGTGTGA